MGLIYVANTDGDTVPTSCASTAMIDVLGAAQDSVARTHTVT